MNLRIAENIKRLRQESQLTQAQLAERLGVSYQAVSRWENETTYPDIELLPSIASLFGVTVDYLLGGTDESRKEALHRDWDKLRALTDPRERVALLRTMHRDHPEDVYLSLRLCAEVPSTDEKRRMTEEIVRDSDVPYARSRAIRQMIRDEDEDRVMELMWHYNIPEECWDELLEDRYRARGESEAYAAKRQWVMQEYLRRAMMRMTACGTDCLPDDPASDEAGARTVLRVIAALVDCPLSEAHPVSGEGSPDLWVAVRVWAGITLACALSAKGDGEKAMTVLEDAADLVVRVRALPEDTPLRLWAEMDSGDKPRSAMGGLLYEPEHMSRQFDHPFFALLREDPRYAARFAACREVFTFRP